MPHRLTDEIIEEILDTTGPCDPAYFGERHPSPEEMRAVADWQLEQVIEWIKQGHLYDLEYHTHCLDMIADLKKAMRPQEDNQ